MYSFSFNGVRKPFIFCDDEGREESVFAPISRNLLKVPGMSGAFLESTDTDVRVINQPIFFQGIDDQDLLSKKEELAGWLITVDPVELVFDKYPGRTYYAVVNGTLDIEEMLNIGEGVITFICPDPYKYGPEKEVELSGPASFLVEGSAEALPVIEVNLIEDITYLAVSNGEEMNIIGNPVKQDETPFEAQTPIWIYSGNNLTGWTKSSSTSIEGAEQTGVLKTDGNNLYTDDYGTGSGWHGTGDKISLPSAVQDLRFDVGFDMRKTSVNQAGGFSVDLLDANNKILASIMMTKHYGGLDTLFGRVRAGNQANGHDVIPEGWANYARAFNGIIRLYRNGNKWTAQVFYRVNGEFLPPVTHSWPDDAGITMAAATQVQVRFLQRGAFPVLEQKIADIQVYRLNDPAAGQVPIIGRAGDVVTFDSINDKILLNGIDISDEKAMIGEYLTFNPGPNTLVSEPMESIGTTKARWRPRWR